MAPRHLDALLIGGGVAAARCARRLRRAGFAGSVAILGEEGMAPYNRPPLSKELLRDEVPDELVLAEPPAWYERHGVELLLGVPAVSFDPAARVVELADGLRLHYGACLLATGASPRQLQIPGGEVAYLLRTLADANAIRASAVEGSRGLVIGGGFIGVEVAASLAARGLSVTLLEIGPALWGGMLGAGVSAWAASRLEEAGVRVRLSTTATAIRDGAVHVGNAILPADVVIAGVGVEPRTELASAAGLQVDGGIVVDEAQRASSAGVFAAGDCARPGDGLRVEHWHAAREGGDRAGSAMAGAPISPRRAPWVFTEFAGVNLDVVGLAVRGDEEQSVRPGLHAFVRDGVVTQVAIMDGAASIDTVRSLVERGGSLGELAERA